MKQIPETGSPSTAPSKMAISVVREGITHATTWNKCALAAIASDPHLQPAAKYQVNANTTHLYTRKQVLIKLLRKNWDVYF